MHLDSQNTNSHGALRGGTCEQQNGAGDEPVHGTEKHKLITTSGPCRDDAVQGRDADTRCGAGFSALASAVNCAFLLCSEIEERGILFTNLAFVPVL